MFAEFKVSQGCSCLMDCYIIYTAQLTLVETKYTEISLLPSGMPGGREGP